MTSIADLRPGDLGFGPIHGAAGALVNAGQLMLGEGFHVGRLDVRHVFVVVIGSRPTGIPDGEGAQSAWPICVEAMPSGARAYPIRPQDRWTPEYAYVRLPEDYPGQAADAAAIARAMIGTPYSFASYLALGAWRFGIRTPRLERWIDRRRPSIPFEGNGTHAQNGTNGFVRLPVEAICSVLADQAWALTGKQVMPEGTPHQCVTPGALAAALLEKEGTQWIWPGKTGR